MPSGPPASRAAVYVLALRATAGPRNAQPDGRSYSLLVFARGAGEVGAEQAARRGLDLLGWTDVSAVRIGEITEPDAVPEDLRPALRRAVAEGCAVIVYDQP